MKINLGGRIDSETAMPLPQSVERLAFSEAFPDNDNLRNLARKIAGLSYQQGLTSGFLVPDVGRCPYNFLAHGQAKSPPLQFLGSGGFDEQLARAKFQRDETAKTSPTERHGFSQDGHGCTTGLSLLFDPLVDAFLILPLLMGCDKYWGGPTVLVLSDYWPFLKLEEGDFKPQGSVDHDWGRFETNRLLFSGIADTAIRILVDTLSKGKLSGKQPRVLTHPDVRTEIEARRLLLWNFFPFFRGGTDATDEKGLPNSISWQNPVGSCWKNSS
jgi:hypothetical protein